MNQTVSAIHFEAQSDAVGYLEMLQEWVRPVICQCENVTSHAGWGDPSFYN
jgi:hypothetical protein